MNLPFLQEARAGLLTRLEFLFLITLWDLENQQCARANTADPEYQKCLPREYRENESPEDYVQDRWFRCTASDLKNHSGWSDKQQEKLLSSLRKKQVIETQRIGLPGKRWVRVNYSWTGREDR